MKILLLGHNGYLGSYLYNKLNTDILETKKIHNNGKKYEYIINCIGKPSIEYCEEHIDETNYSNWLVIEDIKKYYPGSKIINFSSYYVYDDDGLCSEDSKTTDKYAYTRQKLNSEQANINGVTFRIGKLFGNPYAKQNKLFDYIFENDDVVLDDVKFNPTSVDVISTVIQHELVTKRLHGIYNLSNDGIISAYDLGIYMKDVLGMKKNITKIDKMNRQFHNYGKFLMNISKIKKECLINNWDDDYLTYIRIKYSKKC